MHAKLCYLPGYGFQACEELGLCSVYSGFLHVQDTTLCRLGPQLLDRQGSGCGHQHGIGADTQQQKGFC